VDNDSKAEHLVFNKIVGLRDSWEKQKPKPQQNNKPQQAQHKRPAIEVIKQLGKKYTNVPEEKQLMSKAEIIKLAEEVTYEDLQPLFNTAAKKAGTRIATMIALSVLLKNGQERNSDIEEFIIKAKDDKNELLVAEANAI
jgi:glutaminyl-tRNA synthetase